MSTEIKDKYTGYGPHTLYGGGDMVSFYVEGSGSRMTADVSKENFIAAVETELNGIFISTTGDALESAEVDLLAETDENYISADEAQSLARHYAILAVAKRKAGEIDQKQVEALTRLLDEASAAVEWSGTNTDLARAIAATGKVTVTVND